MQPMKGESMKDEMIPDGFVRRKRRSPLTDPWEPIYFKRTDRVVILGLRLAEPHTNGHGLIHGGLIAALSDIAMGYSCGYQSGAAQLVTIGLAVDYVDSARIGQWLAIEPEVIRTGSTICFAQCFAKADDIMIARASASFRVVNQGGNAPDVRQ